MRKKYNISENSNKINNSIQDLVKNTETNYNLEQITAKEKYKREIYKIVKYRKIG
jgi:hypothetical protein